MVRFHLQGNIYWLSAWSLLLVAVIGEKHWLAIDLELTCYWCTITRGFLSPGGNKYGYFFVAPLSEPVYSQLNTSAGEHDVVPMAENNRSDIKWLT